MSDESVNADDFGSVPEWEELSREANAVQSALPTERLQDQFQKTQFQERGPEILQALRDPKIRLESVLNIWGAIDDCHPPDAEAGYGNNQLECEGDPPEPRIIHLQYAIDVLKSHWPKSALYTLGLRVVDACLAFIERLNTSTPEGDIVQPSDGMLWLDRLGIDWLDNITDGGIWGTSYVNDLTRGELEADRRDRWDNHRQSGIALLDFWVGEDDIPDKLYPLQSLTSYIGSNLQRQLDHRPAMAMPIHTEVERVSMREDRHVRQNEDTPQAELFEGDERIAQTPVLESTKLAEIVEQGTDDLQSITGMRLLVWLIRQCHRQKFQGQQQPRVIGIEGGVQALADEIGETSDRGRGRLKKILRAGQSWRVEWSGGEAGGLWTYTHDDTSGPDKRAYLELTIGAPLAPHYNTKALQPGKRTLVPVVELAPFVSPGSLYAQQAAFQQAVVRAIVQRRQQIASRGGAKLSDRDLWQIAEPLGLPQSTMDRAIDRWLHDGDDGLQFLELIDGDLYHLADNERYGLARRFIDDTADRAEQASEAGKRSAQRRKNRE
jgi:hypothetical protein